MTAWVAGAECAQDPERTDFRTSVDRGAAVLACREVDIDATLDAVWRLHAVAGDVRWRGVTARTWPTTSLAESSMSPDLRRRMCPAGRPATRVIAGLCCVALFGLALTGCGSGGAAHAPSHSASASRGARIVSAAPVRGRVQDIVVDSPAVKEQVKVRLLLPMRFSKDRTRHWPVLYLLHGCCDTYVSWNRSTDIEPLTRNLDVLVVMPDGGTVGFYSDWLSGPGWETFHTQELPALLATAYRASGRAVIGGVSMGGLGALDYAARHPGMFTVAASFSGVVHTQLSPEVTQDYLGLIQSRGEDPLGLWGDPNSDVDVWRAHNPYDLAPRLKNVQLFISAGNGQPGPLDDPHTAPDPIEISIAAQNRAFALQARTLGLHATIDLYAPGTHNWVYWQRELHRAWPLIRSGLGLR
jgi:S-formylglutathione hydrolase FrmB